MRRAAVLLFALGACKHPPVAVDAASDADAPLDGAISVEERAPPVVALLAGGPAAADLPVQATEPNAGFDDGLRQHLTTTVVTTGPAPVVSISLGTATVPIPDADRVIAGLRPRMRQGYRTGLDKDPTMSGKVTLTVKVLPSGEVASADVSSSDLSPATAQCVAGVVRRAAFTPPGKSESVLSLPITFSPSK